MPEKAKVLAEDEEVLLDISELESMIPEYAANASDELNDVMLKLFAPHASEAQNKYNERKSHHMARKGWLANIVNDISKNEAQRIQNQNFAEKAKQAQNIAASNKSNGGVGF